MSTVVSEIDTILRPQLLVGAARCGLTHYHRANDLPRILGRTSAPPPGRALDVLVQEEAEMDGARRRGPAAYAITDHIEVLTALLAEARIAQGRPRSDESVRL